MGEQSANGAKWREETLDIGGDQLIVVKGGSGRPLLILHEEVGWPGWMDWNSRLAETHSLLIPLHPGFGRSPRADWIHNVRDLAGFYARWIRESKLAPIDVLGFSFGGWIAAEMAAADPRLFRKMVLVAPVGIRPSEGEIMDVFATTAQNYLKATVLAPERTPEYGKIYGGYGLEETPEQFEAFDDARAEVGRLAWQPYLYNPSLSKLLEGVNNLPSLIIWGRQDRVVPQSVIEAYARALRGSRVVQLDECGHRPEIEQAQGFSAEVDKFLA